MFDSEETYKIIAEVEVNFFVKSLCCIEMEQYYYVAVEKINQRELLIIRMHKQTKKEDIFEIKKAHRLVDFKWTKSR